MSNSDSSTIRLAARRAALVWLLVVLLVSGSCSGGRWVTLRDIPKSPLVERLNLSGRGGGKPSPRTVQVLQRYGVSEKQRDNPEEALIKLQDIIHREATPANLYSFAEVAYLAGNAAQGRDSQEALDYYTACVGYSYMYLLSPYCDGRRNPYDPQFRGACDLYNGGLESLLRILKKEGKLTPGGTLTVESAACERWEMQVVMRADSWHAEDLDEFQFASDYDIEGLRNDYSTYGLGVPLIAVRRQHENESAAEKYYPEGMTFPVTAFLRAIPDATADGQGCHRLLLELYDPLRTKDIAVRDVRVPLETDFSTPLAVFLNKANLGRLATRGLLRPDQWQETAGPYLMQPYQEGKIPVMFVHGLWSEPSAWSEMFNELLADPRIRNNYQFWFYTYPTGQPFWVSAAKMRDDLRTMREKLDPWSRNEGLDNIVLVGHSMGGLISKLQTIRSGGEFWNAVSEEPFQEVNASEETKLQLTKVFFFEPAPSVKRLITIASPHRGSPYANGFTRWLFSKTITLPQSLTEGYKEIYRNNPGVFRKESAMRVTTSIDSLSPNSPLLPVLVKMRSPDVKYHNVAGQEEPGAEGDGIVSLESARPGNFDSEIIVQADHTSIHQHPQTILHVRDILLEHLGDFRRTRQRIIVTSGAEPIRKIGPPPLPQLEPPLFPAPKRFTPHYGEERQ